MLNAATVAYDVLPGGGWRVMVMALEDGGREAPEIVATLAGLRPGGLSAGLAERWVRRQAEYLALERGIPREHVVRADLRVDPDVGFPEEGDPEPQAGLGL